MVYFESHWKVVGWLRFLEVKCTVLPTTHVTTATGACKQTDLRLEWVRDGEGERRAAAVATTALDERCRETGRCCMTRAGHKRFCSIKVIAASVGQCSWRVLTIHFVKRHCT